MTPKVKIFENVFPDFATLPKSLVYHTQKNRAARDSSQPPFCPKLAKWTDRARMSPLIDMSTYTEFGPHRLRFAGLIPERLIFSAPKIITIYIALSLQQ